MASTEQHPLGPQHLAGCLALSKAARWNQNEADWRLMLEMGHGWGLTLADGRLAASTLVLPYGDEFAWISMVLVLPEERRKGHATHLLRVALGDLRDRGLTPVLDATPAGREVYRLEGFRDTWSFKRYALKNAFKRDTPTGVRPIKEEDWQTILRIDREAFGTSREKLLRNLHTRFPDAALIHRDGFILGREGRQSLQLGPLVAKDRQVAQTLLQAALARVGPPLYIDLADHAFPPPEGFEFERPFTRMVHGGGKAPGDATKVFLVAGPELG
jgi:GNAT superfamily N-acetyltransferase